MTLPYAARHSFVLLRPNMEVTLSTPSADTWMCTGKGPASSVAECLRHVLAVPCVPEFFFPTHRTVPSFWEKMTLRYDTTRGAGERKHSNARMYRSNVLPMFGRFGALLRNIHSAITPSILGARGSSSDSRQLSPIPFNHMPNQA